MALGRPAGASEVDRGVVSSDDRAKVLARGSGFEIPARRASSTALSSIYALKHTRPPQSNDNNSPVENTQHTLFQSSPNTLIPTHNVRPLRYQGVPRPNARPPGQHQHALRAAPHLPERRREPQQHRGAQGWQARPALELARWTQDRALLGTYHEGMLRYEFAGIKNGEEEEEGHERAKR
jgi:hypothetical protein